MIIYTNKLGITCIEPEEGFLLYKEGQTYKKVYLGKNDTPESYEEVIDKEYIAEEMNEGVNKKEESFYILTSPNGNKFKLTISDDGEIKTERI